MNVNFNKESLKRYKRRIKQTTKISFDIDYIAGANTAKMVKAHSKAVGCPPEFVFFPLLTALAYCAGIQSLVKVNQEWSEKLILWFVVAARKGGKKSPALERVKDAMAAIETDLQEKHKEEHPDASPRDLPQILVEQFSFEELHEIMKRNDGSVLGMFDEFLSLLNQLDLFKSGANLDRKTLLSLNGGAKWSRNFKKSEPSNLPKTHANFCGMIQPNFVTAMLEGDDSDGLMDRLLIVCPKEVSYYSEDYETPMPPDTPSMKSVLNTALTMHRGDDPVEYTFDQDGAERLLSCHDELTAAKDKIRDDDNRRGIYAKAHGQLVRICGVLKILDNAMTVHVGHRTLEQALVDTAISDEIVDRGYKLVKLLIDTKLALSPPEMILTSDEDDQDRNAPAPVHPTEDETEANKENMQSTLEGSAAPKVKKFLLSAGSSISASVAAQKKLFPSVPKAARENPKNGHPVSAAVSFFSTLEQLGLGQVHQYVHPVNRRRSTVFKKRPFDELNEDALQVVKKLKIGDNEYITSFTKPVADAVEDDF